MKQIVVGVGNPILGDDAVGLEVVRRLKGKISAEIKETMTSGFGLLEEILGYDKAVIVDALVTNDKKEVGKVRKFVIKELDSNSLKTPHALSFLDAIGIAKRSGIKEIPKKIVVVGILVNEIDFKERISEEVKKAIPRAVKVVEGEINGF